MAELSPLCKACQIPLSGVRAIPPRVLRGVRRSPKNPNYCNLCSEKAIKGFITEVTVLFADVRGFTALTHEFGPLRMKELLDEYFREVSDLLFARDAIVDHFMGDAVMAFFTAHSYHGESEMEIHRHNHVQMGVEGAFDVQRTIAELNGRWRLPRPIAVGVGVSTGVAAVGTVGSRDPKDYTAIGDVVNIAARLQGHAEAGEILVTEDVHRAVAAAYPSAEERVLQLKGVEGPVTAYLLRAGGATTVA